MPQQDQQAYQPYQSIRHSVEAIGGKSISDALNLGRTSLEMMDSIHVQLILLLRHHEDIMMRLEELKREKIANEDMEVFPDGKPTQILHIQIEGFTKLKTWISGCRKQKQEKTHQRFTTVKKPGMVLYVFFLNHEDFERNFNLHSPFGDRCQTLRPIKSWDVANRVMWGKTHLCYVWRTSTYALFWFQTGCLALRALQKYIPWFTLAKHIQTRTKRNTPRTRRKCCWKIYTLQDKHGTYKSPI